MMKDYALHYSYKEIGDVIICIFNNEKKPNKIEQKGRVTVLYSNDEIIGYNIKDIKEIVKIRNEGMIFFPSKALIDVLNNILINSGVPPLEYKIDSGYFIAQITSKEKVDDGEYLTLDCGGQIYNCVTKSKIINVGDKVVISKVGTHLNNGEVTKESAINNKTINTHVYTGVELGLLDVSDVLILEEDAIVGKDFFSMEERML